MEKEILEQIKQEASDMEKIVNKDFSEIEELEKDPRVQRYLYLQSLKNSRDLIEYGKRSIVGNIISKYGQGMIKQTNDIWCFLFELEAYQIRGIQFECDDPEQIMVVYRDLENTNRMVAISKEQQAEFESTHRVVYGNTNIFDCYDRYYNTRHQFFEDCINYGQEEAVQRVLTRYV